jgi:hypothetical protein
MVIRAADCEDCKRRVPERSSYNPACFDCGVHYLRYLLGARSMPEKTRHGRIKHVQESWAKCGHDPVALLATARRGAAP